MESLWLPETWPKVRTRSWTAGEWLRRWGNRWYGSEWNALTPMWDEWRIRRLLPKGKPHIVHWLWGEFAAPKRAAVYRKRGGKVVVSVHCSARRWDKVWLRPDGYAQADMVVLTSESQRPCVEQTVPPERVTTILHGVESGYFTPGQRVPGGKKRLRLFLFGNTERDHAFAAAVAKQLPPSASSGGFGRWPPKTTLQWHPLRDDAATTVVRRGARGIPLG